jgi:1-acyl-sn-glycerol-3-phosphate acyltransferase
LKSIFRSIKTSARIGYEYFAMLLGLGALTNLCLLGLPFVVICLCLPNRWRKTVGRTTISFAFRFYLRFLRVFCWVRLDASALDSLKNAGSLIVVANHPSLLDAVILLSRFSGYITNDDPLQLIKQACNELASNAQLVIFPESTRTTDETVNAFGLTTALIALRSNTPIQTVFLDFSTRYLGKSWGLLRPPSLPLVISIRLGKRFQPAGSKEGLTLALETYYAENLRASNQGRL